MGDRTEARTEGFTQLYGQMVPCQAVASTSQDGCGNVNRMKVFKKVLCCVQYWATCVGLSLMPLSINPVQVVDLSVS